MAAGPKDEVDATSKWTGKFKNKLCIRPWILKDFSMHTTFSLVLLLASASFCFMGQWWVFEILLIEKIGMFEDEVGKESWKVLMFSLPVYKNHIVGICIKGNDSQKDGTKGST